MAYIGNTPADKFLTLAKQSFSTSATTSYTLDSSISSTQDIALFINNVRQSPVDAYTVSGTALTLTSATAGTDEMYCVYLGKTVGTVSPSANSVTNAMLTGSIDLTSKVTGTLPIANGGTGAATLAAAGLVNTPAFQAYLSAAQSVSTDTWTKLQANTEVFDTDGCYDNSTNYRFTPTVSGKYYFYGIVNVISTDTNTGYDYGGAEFKKNGTVILRNEMTIIDTGSQYWYNINGVIDMNGSSDYLEMFAYITGSGTLTFQGGATTGRNSRWGAYKLIGA